MYRSVANIFENIKNILHGNDFDSYRITGSICRELDKFSNANIDINIEILDNNFDSKSSKEIKHNNRFLSIVEEIRDYCNDVDTKVMVQLFPIPVAIIEKQNIRFEFSSPNLGNSDLINILEYFTGMLNDEPDVLEKRLNFECFISKNPGSKFEFRKSEIKQDISVNNDIELSQPTESVEDEKMIFIDSNGRKHVHAEDVVLSKKPNHKFDTIKNIFSQVQNHIEHTKNTESIPVLKDDTMQTEVPDEVKRIMDHTSEKANNAMRSVLTDAVLNNKEIKFVRTEDEIMDAPVDSSLNPDGSPKVTDMVPDDLFPSDVEEDKD